MKFAEEMAANPAGLNVARQLIDPGMLQRLEGNEPEMTTNPDGVIE
jgi:hypothetical protein